MLEITISKVRGHSKAGAAPMDNEKNSFGSTSNYRKGEGQ
jgi:hypothetical protein